MWRKDVSGSTLALSRKKADCGELSLFGLKMLKKQNSAYAHMSAERQSIMSLSSVYGVFFSRQWGHDQRHLAQKGTSENQGEFLKKLSDTAVN